MIKPTLFFQLVLTIANVYQRVVRVTRIEYYLNDVDCDYSTGEENNEYHYQWVVRVARRGATVNSGFSPIICEYLVHRHDHDHDYKKKRWL